MKFENLGIPELVHIIPKRIGDSRGFFSETFRQDLFTLHAGRQSFVQENQSFSAQQGTIRGLHFQAEPFAQGKLVRCITGEIFDVAVDLRHGSPNFGRWEAAILTAALGNQLWVPPGFAHGFCTLVPDTNVVYSVTSFYSPQADKGLAWDDPDLRIGWPGVADAETLSSKDRQQPGLAELPEFFRFEV